MDSKFILIVIACIAILLIFGKYFLIPAKIIIKLICNSALGALLIFIINIVGTTFSFHIGLSIINSIVVGILGIPRSFLIGFNKNILQNIKYKT